jgi:hypothetical protein
MILKLNKPSKPKKNQIMTTKSLYSFDKKHVDTINLLWVASVASKDSTRYSIHQIIHIEGGWAVATDGKSLHCARVEHIEDGDYRIYRQNKTVLEMEMVEVGEINFPNWQQVIPGGGGIIMNHERINKTENQAIAISQILKKLPGTFDYKRLELATNYGAKNFDAVNSDENSPMLISHFKDGVVTARAVIMVIRVTA